MSNQKRAAFQILAFLQSSISTLKSDDQEGIEVASKFHSMTFYILFGIVTGVSLQVACCCFAKER